ncbi:amidohydrolase, partial [Streptococcus suis]
MKIDVFAHVGLPEFKKRMLMLDDDLLTKYPFARHPDLDNLALRREHAQSDVRQIVSYINTNPEDYMAGKMAALLVRKANEGLLETVKA